MQHDDAGAMKTSRGSALLEVMLAVAMMAVTGLGLAITQLSSTRNTQWAMARERAAFVADALAESAQEGSTGNQGADQWKARMATLLPDGAVSITTSGTNTSIATVTWPAAFFHVTGQSPSASFRPCASANVAADRACVFIAFAP